MKVNIDYSLYLVTDRGILNGRSLEDAVEQSILGGTSIVQLREKDASSLEFYKIALSVKKITDKYNVPLIINDRVDIALAVDAAGVHVGQTDIPPQIVRRIIGLNKILGVSTQNVEQAIKAKEAGADYVGVGAIFPTTSKSDAKVVTINELKAIKNNIDIPVIAIGGINERNVKTLSETEIDGIAVISSILEHENIRTKSEYLLSLFKSR